MKKIILTGATGYLGSKLADKLIQKNHHVFCIVMSKDDLNYLLPLSEKVSLLEITDFNFEEKIQKFAPDTIIHCAALYENSDNNLMDLIDANYSFPCRILTALYKSNINVHWINTDTALNPFLNSYSLTKHQFAQIGRYYSSFSNINFSNILLEQFYGENDSGSKFIPFLLGKMKNNEEINLTDGLQRRDFVYIDDVVSAYEILLENPCHGFQEYSLGTGAAPKVREIVEYLKEITQSKSKLNFGVIEKRKNEPECLVADIENLKQLGYSVKYKWQDGLNKTVEESK